MTSNWQPPPGAAPPHQNPNKPSRVPVIAAVVVIVAGLAVGAGLVLVNRGDDDAAEQSSFAVIDELSLTPVFEPLDARGNDPFFPLEAQLVTYQAEVEDEMAVRVQQAQANAQPSERVEAPEFDVAALDASVKTGALWGH